MKISRLKKNAVFFPFFYFLGVSAINGGAFAGETDPLGQEAVRRAGHARELGRVMTQPRRTGKPEPLTPSSKENGSSAGVAMGFLPEEPALPTDTRRKEGFFFTSGNLIFSVPPLRRETDMIRALKNGDIKGFKTALRTGIFEEPALKFLRDWTALTEEGNYAVRLLAGMRLNTKEEREEAARVLHELLRLFSFPVSDRIQPGALTFQRARVLQPLERSSLYSAVMAEDFEAFKKGLEELLSASTDRLLAVLHSVTGSGTTLIGLIDQTLDEKRAEKWRRLLKQVIFAFHQPILTGGLAEGERLLPQKAAQKAKNTEMYYVLRHFSTEDGTLTGLSYAMILGAGGAVGAASDFLWGGGLKEPFAFTAAYGPVALSALGIACYRLFKFTKQRGIIRRLEQKNSPL